MHEGQNVILCNNFVQMFLGGIRCYKCVKERDLLR